MNSQSPRGDCPAAHGVFIDWSECESAWRAVSRCGLRPDAFFLRNECTVLLMRSDIWLSIQRDFTANCQFWAGEANAAEECQADSLTVTHDAAARKKWSDPRTDNTSVHVILWGLACKNYRWGNIQLLYIRRERTSGISDIFMMWFNTISYYATYLLQFFFKYFNGFKKKIMLQFHCRILKMNQSECKNSISKTKGVTKINFVCTSCVLSN